MKTLINLFDECFERFGSSILTGLFIFHAGVANILLSIRREESNDIQFEIYTYIIVSRLQ